MKVIETQSAILANHEVLLHVQGVQQRYAAHAGFVDQSGAALKQLHLVVHDTIHYLSDTTTTPISTYTSDMYRELLTRLSPFRLMKGELLALLNHRPSDPATLDPLVEECEERFTMEQREEILRIVGDVLGAPLMSDGSTNTASLEATTASGKMGDSSGPGFRSSGSGEQSRSGESATSVELQNGDVVMGEVVIGEEGEMDTDGSDIRN